MEANDPLATNKIDFYLSCLNDWGFTSEQVLYGTELTKEEIQQVSFRATPDQYHTIINNMINLTGNPALGIVFGSEFKISYLGVLGYAVLSSSNLRQSREVLARYHILNDQILNAVVTINNDLWRVDIAEVFPLHELIAFAIEDYTSRVVNVATYLTNKPFPILKMHLTYSRPEDMTAYDSKFNCPMFFDQPRNQLFFSTDCLENPITLANESVFHLCEQQCQVLAHKIENSSLLSVKIRDTLAKSPGEFPSLDELSCRININQRTIRRKLMNEGLTYKQILESWRRDLALQYLENTSMAPKEIGYILGYSNVSNFRRAFKNWTGKKLSDFRC